MLTLFPPVLDQQLSPSFIYINGDGVQEGAQYNDELYVQVTKVPQASQANVLECIHQLYLEGKQLILTLREDHYIIWSRLD
ncbi:MAG: hypothetical protein AAGF24_05370 [Cyanobacteria bacterium P01_H01_bin.121]